LAKNNFSLKNYPGLLFFGGVAEIQGYETLVIV